MSPIGMGTGGGEPARSGGCPKTTGLDRGIDLDTDAAVAIDSAIDPNGANRAIPSYFPFPLLSARREHAFRPAAPISRNNGIEVEASRGVPERRVMAYANAEKVSRSRSLASSRLSSASMPSGSTLSLSSGACRDDLSVYEGSRP